MTFNEVKTLFHEFGHGLQHMLTTVNEYHVSGINGVEWDAVELPSQFMENWCYHKPTLLNLTSHVETGEKLPEVLFDKINQARTYRSANNMLRQIHFGLIDMALHHHYKTSSQTIFEINESIAQSTLMTPPIKEDRFLCSFSHIFAGSYAAGYYSYKWAEVLSADAFSAFEEVDLENPEKVAEIGTHFKKTVLSLGGSLHPSDIFEKFRGRAPNVKALLRHHGLLSDS